MTDLTQALEKLGQKLSGAIKKLKESSQGRVYYVGRKVIYKNKLGVITMLNKFSTDVAGTTVDITCEDGEQYVAVPINSPSLDYLRQ